MRTRIVIATVVVAIGVALAVGTLPAWAQEGGRRPTTVAGCSATDFAKFYPCAQDLLETEGFRVQC